MPIPGISEGGRRGWPLSVPAILLLLLSLLFYGKFLGGSKILWFHDLKTHHYPWRVFSVREYLDLRFPLWNPFNAFGFPHIAEGEGGALYPFGIAPFLITRTPYALTLYALIHTFMAGLFMFLFLRRSGFSPHSSLMGGIAFAFSGFMVAHTIYPHFIAATVYLPLLLYLIRRGFDDRMGIRSFFPLAPVVALTLLAGHPQGAGLSLFFSGVYFLFLLFQKRGVGGPKGALKGRVLPFLLASIFGISFALPQILPTLELTRYSSRAKGVSEAFAFQGNLPPIEVIRAVFPESFGVESPADIETIYHHRGERYLGTGQNYWETSFYAGLLPFLFSLLAFFSGRWRLDERTFFRVSLIFSLLLVFGDSTPFYPLFRHIPPFSFFRMPARFSLWLLLSLIYLSAAGFDIFCEGVRGNLQRGRGVRRFAILCGVFAILIASLFPLVNRILVSSRERLFEMGERHYQRKIETYQELLKSGGVVKPHEVLIPELHDMDYYRKRMNRIYSELLYDTEITGRRVLVPLIMLILPCLAFFIFRRPLPAREAWLEHLPIPFILALVTDLFIFGVPYQKGIPAEEADLEVMNTIEKGKEEGAFRIAVLHRRADVKYEERLLTPSLNLLEGVDEVFIPSPLAMVKADRLLDATGLGLAIYSLDIKEEYKKREEILSENLPLAGLMNVRFILSTEDVNEGVGLERRGSSGGVRVYENPYSLPRAFLSPGCRVLDEEEVFRRLEGGDFRPEEVLLVRGEVDEGVCGELTGNWQIGSSESRVEITYPSPLEVEITAKGDQGGILFISDTFYPGWRAWVDGREAEIMRAFGIFRAIRVKEGERVVRLRYRPDTFYIPLFIALVSLLFFVFLSTVKRQDILFD